MFGRTGASIVLYSKVSSSRPLSRVVITGAGIVTALGIGWAKNAEGFRFGRNGIQPVTLLDVTRQRVKVAAEVRLPETLPRTRLSPRQAGRGERGMRMLLWAAHEAWEQSGWVTAEGEESSGASVVLGTTGAGMTLGEAYYRQAIGKPRSFRGQPVRVTHYQAQRQALDLAEAFGITGPLTVISNACASGANAIGHAWWLLRQGRADRVLAGGYDALAQVTFSGFDSLQALSPTQCRPFDVGRDGLALGEGAAMVTLETLESATRRGAMVLGEIVGYGAGTDVHHLTQPHPEGQAAWETMTQACRMADVKVSDIGYINAHGTGTVLNDAAEAKAINRWAGEEAGSIPVSSIKGGIGHLLGASGAVEAVVCLMVLREGWLPPTVAVRTVDPVCRFPVVTSPTTANVEHVLTNSFGFGGANATLLLRRWS
jgi:3-oxoacyl-[acyl-carrier-protein] synthase II